MKQSIKIVVALVVLIIITAMITGGNSKIKVGDKVPLFSLTDQNGEVFHLDSIIGTKNLVIFFYPKDFTPGCTREVCKFRDEFEDFVDLDAEVIGISGDDKKSHLKFANKYKLPFTLLSDGDKTVRKQFGVPSTLFGMLPGRVTYIVDKQGIVRHVFDSQFDAEQHIEEAKKVLKELD